MTDGSRKHILETAFSLDDFQGLGRRKIWRLISIFMSEFFATGILVFLLCAAVQGAVFGSGQSHLVIGTTAGFAVATSVLVFGHISGSHINPALSLAAVVLGELSLALFVFYTVAQCLGATFGYALTRAILPPELSINPNSTDNDLYHAQFCCSVPANKFHGTQVLLAEIIGTAILSWAFCSALDSRNLNKHDSLPIKFGAVIIALALPVGLYSGCSINPARTFGPAFYNQYWTNHWIYWIGPMVGTIFASVSYRIFFDKSRTEIQSSNKRRDSSNINLRSNSHKCDDDA